MIINTPPQAIISSPNSSNEYLDSDPILFDASNSYDVDNDELSFKWVIGGEDYYEPSFTTKVTVGQYLIQLYVDDGDWINITSVTITVYSKTEPDLSINPSEVVFVDMDDPLKIYIDKVKEGKTVYITIVVNNVGNVDANASVDFNLLRSGSTVGGELLGTDYIYIPAESFKTSSIKWEVPEVSEDIDYTIRIEISECDPEETHLSNNVALKPVRIVKDDPPAVIPLPSGATAIAIVCAGVGAFFRRRRLLRAGETQAPGLPLLSLYKT